MRIRTAQPTDIGEIVQIYKQCGLYSSRATTPRLIRRVMKNFPQLFLVAMNNGKPVGTVYGLTDGRIGLICKLGVAPLHRRRGVGEALLKELITRLRKRCERILVIVERTNRVAIRLYEKLGFERREKYLLLRLSQPF